MPYIPKADREKVLNEMQPKTVGELNYLMTMLCSRFLDNTVPGKRSYQDYNNVIGALESCKLEMYHKVVRPYEEDKIDENGDVEV